MKTAPPQPSPESAAEGKCSLCNHPLVLTCVLLAIVLSALFYQSFDANKVHFSNDGPLGAMVAEQNRLPRILTGFWTDENWLGAEGLTPPPSITTLLRLLPPWNPSPFLYARILPPASLFIVSLSACFCFRRYKLAPIACVLGGLAAGLNSDFLSTSCWGVASQTVGFGAMFVGLGLLANGNSRHQWIRVVLAGLAVGIGVMEAYDIGALFSLFVAAFVIYQAIFMREGEMPGKLGMGIGRVALVAIFAAFISAQALTGLIGTQLVGVTGTNQDKETKQKMWPMMTEWSLPKAEALQVIIPGVFGYRNTWHMYDDDQPQEDQYWGVIGADPSIGMAQDLLKGSNPEMKEQAEAYLKNPNLLWRLVGTGFYAGVPVVVIALWAMLQAFRGERSPFTKFQRRAIQFWTGAAIISLLFSFGKFAPFYQLFYALPYASAIRNPDKFMHVFTWALLIVFGYGAHGLVVTYLRNPASRAEGFKNWWARATAFERRWIIGCGAAIVLSVVAWMIYAQDAARLQNYITSVAISPDLAPAVAKFSIHAVGWFVLLLILTVLLLVLIFSGKFSHQRANWAAGLLGLLMVFDLGRAGQPWIIYQDIPYKYASDPVIKLLADKPYEHRVAMLPVPVSTQQQALLQNAYGSHWKQFLFCYYDIQCADVIQEPRVTQDKDQFSTALPMNSFVNLMRFWQLSNTRYILAPGGDFVSKQLDPGGRMFRVLMPFEFEPKRPNATSPVDFSAQPKTNGELAVLEFLGALPRAKLYSNWTVNNDDTNTLQTIASLGFDPQQTVLVADPSLSAPKPADAAQPAGTNYINPNYRSKRIEVATDVKVPSVLLLSERYNPKWRVTVDGQPAKLLRCNFILRGVSLQPGKHTVVFEYKPPLTALYVSLTAIVIGLLLAGYLVACGDCEKSEFVKLSEPARA